MSVQRTAMWEACLADEAAILEGLIEQARPSPAEAESADRLARRLVAAMRAGRRGWGGVDQLMAEYALDSQEGIVLMCLAEALLRVPDSATADALIRDKIGGADWKGHLGHSDSLLVNASTWGLMLTGRVIALDDQTRRDPLSVLGRLVARSGEPVIRQAMNQAMRILGKQFVLGRTIEEALDRAREMEARGYRHSYDMLGEAAYTAADAARYLESYHAAIAAIGHRVAGDGAGDVFTRPSISVKLSALHPRYEFRQRDRVLAELAPRLLTLATAARQAGIGLTVDAEEADRLELSLELLFQVAADPALKGWDGLGLAVQAYQKRALPVLDMLATAGRALGRRWPVRLVKGAYWDSEIKRAQLDGLKGYPVFTRKQNTDVSYLAAARRMLGAPEIFRPQFATHNAQTLAAIRAMAPAGAEYEFQRLHGMGQALYEEVVGADKLGTPCRIYAPVGSHEDLLAYLVRRLLENGANTSFVNRLADDEAPIADIVADPVSVAAAATPKSHPGIPLPADLHGADRANSPGVPLWHAAALDPLLAAMKQALAKPLTAQALPGAKRASGPRRAVEDPSGFGGQLGEVVEAGAAEADQALARAHAAWPAWDALGGPARAGILDQIAQNFLAAGPELMGLLVREAGKTIDDAQSELREAVDFCRYYAARARADFAGPVTLAGPTGELNQLALGGRGVFVCISPWNFPLAIFAGQVVAALAAGNAVLAKPAEPTPLVAFRAIALMHQAGVPQDVLHYLPGKGSVIGAALTADPRVAGVAFTGSTETGWRINRALAARDAAIAPLIAETGGQNAMIVDSTALPEQVTRDVLRSAFASAGQRCSALRVLFLQEDIAPRVEAMIAGAMAELRLGDPMDPATDIGPVIDAPSRQMLAGHAARMKAEGRAIGATPLPPALAGQGHFFAPAAFGIDRIDQIGGEKFGPILHVIRWQGGHLARVCDAINESGFGLTCGVHSRIAATTAEVAARVRAGNIYVNRNMIGAVVGVQPFGGQGLSGTGPKAGGPHYLHRFATEKSVSTDTTAAGGNATLLSLAEG